MTATTRAQRASLPTAFWGWLVPATSSAWGDSLLYFGLGWAATGISPATAGALLTLVTVPRALLLLAGGSLADRYGLRRVMVAGDGTMVAALAAYLVVGWGEPPTVTALALLALICGVVSAAYLPAMGAFPRVFVADDDLPRAMAASTLCFQVARLLGPAAAGWVVVGWGLSGVALLDLLTFVAVLVALLVVRPARELPRAPGAQRPRALEALRTARRLPGVPAMLLATGLLAAAVLPVLSILVPVAARERGWGAGGAGLVEAAWVVGTMGVTVVVARRGSPSAPLVHAAAATVLVGVGALGLAATSQLVPALVSGCLLGMGTAGFTTQVAPMLVRHSPHDQMARFQALLGVVQATGLVVANNAVGWLAGAAGAVPALVACAVLAVSAGAVLACWHAGLADRTDRQPTSPDRLVSGSVRPSP